MNKVLSSDIIFVYLDQVFKCPVKVFFGGNVLSKKHEIDVTLFEYSIWWCMLYFPKIFPEKCLTFLKPKLVTCLESDRILSKVKRDTYKYTELFIINPFQKIIVSYPAIFLI